jgi:hypothetical protein
MNLKKHVPFWLFALLAAVVLTIALSSDAAQIAAPQSVTLSSPAGPNQQITATCALPCPGLSLQSGSSGTFAPVDATHYTFTAPPAISAQHSTDGCMVAPNDSIYNTRIDSLPVHPNSADWIAHSSGILFNFETLATPNIIDNATPVVAETFHYTTNYNSGGGTVWRVPSRPGHKERGWFSLVDLPTATNSDHHSIFVNKNTCQWEEFYQEGIYGSTNTAASGYQYLGSTYARPADGTTDAASQPLVPLMLSLDEILSRQIHHAMRFTSNYVNPGVRIWPSGVDGPSAGYPPYGARFRLKAGFVQDGVIDVTAPNSYYFGSFYPTGAPTLSFTGCAVQPVANVSQGYGGYITQVNVTAVGSGCVKPTVVFNCNLPCTHTGTAQTGTAVMYSPEAQAILTAWKQYGISLSDIGYNNSVTTSTDVFDSPIAAQALAEISCPQSYPHNCQPGQQANGITNNAWEAVDVSALMVSPSSYETTPAYATGQYAVITGPGINLPIALQPAVIQTPYLFAGLQAGMSAWTIPAAVYPASLNQTVNWAITTCAGPFGCGSIGNGNQYTPPASVSAETAVTLTGTAAADPTQTANLYLTILPAGPVRIHSGSQQAYTDSSGHQWLPDMVSEGAYGHADAVGQNWGTQPDQALYQNYAGGADDIHYGTFIVPNGSYKISMLFSTGGCTGTAPSSPLNLVVQGVVQAHDYDPAASVNYACKTETPVVTLPAKVTDNTLRFGVFGSMRDSGWDVNSFVSAVSFEQDSATVPHWDVDTQQQSSIAPGASGQWNCQTGGPGIGPAVGIPGTLQLYLRDALTGVNDPTWIKVFGPGRVDPASGCYTAPPSNQGLTPVIIEATDGATTAYTSLLVSGGNVVAAPVPSAAQ